jgi:hypothetical protein
MDDLFELEVEARTAADASVTPSQEALKPGDYCLREAHGLAIYSEILDAAEVILGGRDFKDLDPEDQEEVTDTRKSYAQPHMRYYRFTRSYSRACPNGELGDIHVSTVKKVLTAVQFQAAREAGWP